MTHSINYTRILMSLASIAFVGALVVGGTGAFFNDTETSTDNVFAAGGIDLLIDSESHYNGMICQLTDQGYIWVFPGGRGNPDNNPESGQEPNLWGEPCEGSWEESDLGPTHTFFNFSDLKPGDEGENTISLHVYDNDAYACAIIDNMHNDEVEPSCTEPEAEDGDVTCDTSPENGEGELAQELHFFAWIDQGTTPGFGNEEDEGEGDNIWQGPNTEPQLFSNTEGPASDVLDGVVYPLFTPDINEGQVMVGSTTYYIGLYWCYGEISTDGDVLSCDGAPVNNLSQTDQLSADISFYVEQARNNEEFECPLLERAEPQDPVGANLSLYVPPDIPECDATVSGAESIQTEVDGVGENEIVCVDDTYDRTGDDIAIRIETNGVKLAALTQGILLDVPVVLSADGVIVTGFEGTIGQAESPAEQAAFYLDDDATNASITFNEVDGGAGAAVLTETGADNSGSNIMHNVFQNATQGIYTNPHTGTITIQLNDIDGNVAGIGGLNGALVVFNEFEHTLAAPEAIGIDSTFDANPATINNNNFLDDTRLNTYGTITPTIDAENNFWGPNGGASQTDDNGGTNIIDFDPEALVMFPHS